MPVYLMRERVRKQYPGKKWSDKVSKMSDAQIIGLYYKFVSGRAI
jgi:hypothetical protein